MQSPTGRASGERFILHVFKIRLSNVVIPTFDIRKPELPGITRDQAAEEALRSFSWVLVLHTQS